MSPDKELYKRINDTVSSPSTSEPKDANSQAVSKDNVPNLKGATPSPSIIIGVFSFLPMIYIFSFFFSVLFFG